MQKANLEIRETAARKGVFLWEIAEVFGVHDTNFSRKLRNEFSPEDKAKALAAIDTIYRKHMES